MPKKKKKKLSKKKRSKSWDEEAAKQEQQRRQNMEKRRGSLAVRKDVVNKTLLRSIKRLVTQKFEDFSGFKDLSSSEQKEKFLELVEKFTIHYFPDISKVMTIEDTTTNDEESILSQNGIKFIVGWLVNQNISKTHFKSIKERTFFYLFQNLLKKYSHRKLVRLMSNDNFIFVVASLRENGGLDEIIDQDPWNKNKQAYYEAANSFITKFL